MDSLQQGFELLYVVIRGELGIWKLGWEPNTHNKTRNQNSKTTFWFDLTAISFAWFRRN